MPLAAALRPPTACPCGSGASYAACCGALHRGLTAGGPSAPTAEALMRSRYSAFAVGDPAYLLATWHPATRPATVDLDPGVAWTGLQIVATQAGGPADAGGSVEFVARYRTVLDGRAGEQREHSAFVRAAGRWVYVGPLP